MIEPKAFTLANPQPLLWLTTPCEIGEAYDPNDPNSSPCPKKKYVGLWDTGASSSMITNRVASELGLLPTGFIQSYHAQGKSLVNTYIVNVLLLNGIHVYNLKVTEGKLLDGVDMLIGMDIINLGDFAITHKNGGTVFSFQIPSTRHYDFVKKINNEITPSNSMRAKRSKKKKKKK